MYSGHMTMEEVFIATYIAIILLAFLIAIPVYWIFEKDNKKDNEKENNDCCEDK